MFNYILLFQTYFGNLCGHLQGVVQEECNQHAYKGQNIFKHTVIQCMLSVFVLCDTLGIVIEVTETCRRTLIHN